jgi:hypothetical protein
VKVPPTIKNLVLRWLNRPTMKVILPLRLQQVQVLVQVLVLLPRGSR